MTPNELKKATLKQLREARSSMLELEYLIALEGLSDEEKKEAALNLSNIQLAYLKLRKTKLAEIRSALEENNADLTASIKALQKSLKTLNEVKAIIGAAAEFVSVIARIIPLL